MSLSTSDSYTGFGINVTPTQVPKEVGKYRFKVQVTLSDGTVLESTSRPVFLL